MAAPPLMRSFSTRAVKKVEKPRPLKTSSSQSKISNDSASLKGHLSELMSLVETVSQNLYEKNYSEMLTSSIATMHMKLKQNGQQLESIYKDQLDRAFVIFRNGCQDDNLQCATRLHLLELVELRANQWSNCDNTLIYYSAKMAATEIEPAATTPDANTNTIPMSTPSPPTPPVLGPGEVLKTSGKFIKPTKIPGKNYCKDEVVIRNSDSGKVMGIKGRRVHMIEELSETIISFQRVNPGAKERLVQITGPSEDKINHARQLMEDTIRRNASPVREGSERDRIGGSSSSLNSSASDESNRLTHQGSRRSLLHSFSTNDASLGEYKYTVSLGNETVKITGTNHDTVRNARLVLEEYYHIWLQKNCMGDYGLDEDVFIDPVAQDMAVLRLNSLDSVSGLDTAMGFQPMYPGGPTERRALLGRSNSIPLASPQSPLSQDVGVTRKYSRDFLLSCAVSYHSRSAPPNWDQISLECPAIVKKASPPFDPTNFLARPESSAVISSTQLSNEPDSD